MNPNGRLNIPDPVPYADQLKEQTATQVGVPRDRIRSHLENTAEYVFDPENVPVIKHNWVDRGLKMSCEGAGHPYHQSWKRKA